MPFIVFDLNLARPPYISNLDIKLLLDGGGIGARLLQMSQLNQKPADLCLFMSQPSQVAIHLILKQVDFNLHTLLSFLNSLVSLSLLSFDQRFFLSLEFLSLINTGHFTLILLFGKVDLHLSDLRIELFVNLSEFYRMGLN